MSTIQGKAVYASLPWGKEKSDHIKVTIELDDGTITTTWITKARALELAGQLKRLVE